MDKESVESEEKEVETINVTPLKKWPRFLSFLADYFLTFILALLLFHIACFPLGSVITKAPERYDEYLSSLKRRDNVLYGNKILYYDESSSNKDPDSFSVNLDYTCRLFVGYYLGEEDAEVEVFQKYYQDLAKNKANPITLYQEADKETKFFDFVDGQATLKEGYKVEFSALYVPGDEMSSQGQKDYETFQNKFFLRLYSSMLNDIYENDLFYNQISYRENQSVVLSYKTFSDTLVLSSVLISYFISSMVISLLVPLVTSHQKSLGNLILRYERIDAATLRIYSKKKVPLVFVYAFAMNASCLLFVPWGNVGFNELFSLPMLLPLSLVSLVLSIASLAFLLFDSFNRDLADRLSFTVMLSESSLADIYRAKGYDF